MKIKFKQTTSFLGRNGLFKCTGVSVWPYTRKEWKGYKVATETPVVWIEPWTSKGTIGRCFIEIPAEDIPNLIKALQAASKGVNHE